MKNSVSNILCEITNDIYVLQSLLIHASACRRTKAEIKEDLDKMSDVINEIKELIG